MSLAVQHEFESLELGPALEEAVAAYSWQTPEGSTVWCPYLRNGGPCQPLPGMLDKPGGGKASPEEFREAAAYAYELLDTTQYENPKSIADAVGKSLIDGSLPDERRNYTGIDCSGFTVQALASALNLRGINFYGNLCLASERVFDYIPNEPVEIQREILLMAFGSARIKLADYLAMVSPNVNPARRISAKLLLENTIPVAKDAPILAGDIIDFTSSSLPPITHHPALVVGAGKKDRLRLAHSTRISPYNDTGGVTFFETTAKQLFNSRRYRRNLGYPAVRRLAMLENPTT